MNNFLFITAFIISVFISVDFMHEIKHKTTKKKTSALAVNVRSVARGVSVFMLSIGLADKFGLIDFSEYSGTYFLMGICCMAEFILCEINKKHNTAVILFAVKTILTALVLELVLFNCSAYRTWFGDYPQLQYNATQLMLDRGGVFNDSNNTIDVRDGEELVVRIMKVGYQVNTVYLDMELDGGTRSAEVVLDASDEAQSYATRWNVARSLISRKREQTKYIQCELSGKVGELAVKLKPIYSGSAHIKSITLNRPIPFEISWVRFLVIVLLSIFIYSVVKGTFMNKSITENRRFCRISTVCVTVFACLWAIYTIHYHFDGGTWKDQLKQTNGSQVSKQLVDAFEDGRTYLYPQPEEALIEFDNPYDRQHREAELVPNLTNYYGDAWDHVYFEGKFYSYYGIAPVILLFLPYHVLTGYYFPHSIAVLIFSLIGIIGLSAFYTKFIKKFFPDIPTGMFIASLIIIQMISGIWFSIGRPDFYEVAMSSGFAFMTWAFYFLISANIIGKEKISLIKTAVASLLFAVAVLCRPTTVLYCICAFVFMACAMPKFSDNGKKKIFNKKSITYLACALVPMACLGLVQMIYNYARFGSPFEFGIQYSLTINDFRNAQFHWRLSLIPLFNYLFNTPTFTPVYPFIAGNFQNMNVGGFFYDDCPATHSVCGLFFLALPMFAYTLSGKALKTIPDRKDRLKKSMYIMFPCIVIPLIIICSVWESGYAIRYMADFAWQMLIGAYIILFWLYMKSQNPTIKKMINIFLCISLAWTIVVGGVQIFNQEFRYVDAHYDYPEMAYELEKIFMFWK